MSAAIHHRLDIYGTELHAAFDRRGWRSLRRRNDDLWPFTDLGDGLTVDSRSKEAGHQHVWIWVNLDAAATDADLVNTIAHEANHAAEAILHRCAAPASGEPMAYLVGWIAEWLFAGAMTRRTSRPA